MPIAHVGGAAYGSRARNPSIPLLRHPSRLELFAGRPKKQTIALACPAMENFPKCDPRHTSSPIPERCCLRVTGENGAYLCTDTILGCRFRIGELYGTVWRRVDCGFRL